MAGSESAAQAHGPTEIIALGEAMVEFNQTSPDLPQYLQGFGGDTSNFAIAVARSGGRAGYQSMLGDDVFGAAIRQLWREEHVDQQGVGTNPDAFTAVYFVTHGEKGHAFSFLRKGSAAARITPADLAINPLAQAKVLHMSGISLAISAQARETCFRAIAIGKAAGVRISFDTNYRARLWRPAEAFSVMRDCIAQADICLAGSDDFEAMAGLSDPDAILDFCRNEGAAIVVLRRGSLGAILDDGSQRIVIPPYPCKPVDATGAGDAFGGAFVTRLVHGDTALEAAHYAAVAAAMSTEGYGAVAPIPFHRDVIARRSESFPE